VTYFVTFRLADSIPQATLDLWVRERDDWLYRHPEPRDVRARREYYRLFVERFQKWLDAGYGDCVLGQPAVRKIVTTALGYFETTRYLLREWVVMPNSRTRDRHADSRTRALGYHPFLEIIHRQPDQSAVGRTEKLWQKEPFDHIVRGPDQLQRIEQYIHDNPRGLPEDRYALHCLHEKTRTP